MADFYRQHHDRLWRSLLGYTGDPELASEAEAEALTQALRRGDQLYDPAAWIWRTAYRIAGRLLAEGRRRPLPVAEVPDRALAGDPLIETLDMLDVLTPQQRAIVTLRYVADLKPTEIADIIDSTPGSVRVQLHRAHANLRQTWSDK